MSSYAKGSPYFVHYFPHVRRVAELAQGRGLGGAGRHPTCQVVVDLVSEIRLDLARQVFVTAFPLQKSQKFQGSLHRRAQHARYGLDQRLPAAPLMNQMFLA